ncbi:MAG: alkaline phosphatase PhoX [Planctomycetota bacterium]|nr:alkaline phosphatase PhoX [Planctomycetota bacterium]
MSNLRLPGTRREFLGLSSAAVSSLIISDTLSQLNQIQAATLDKSGSHSPYGPLRPVKDQTTGLALLSLPAGFEYLTHGWTGQIMSDGRKTPPAHDGTGVIDDDKGLLTLCRNHEVNGLKPAFAHARNTYDSQAGGGTTNFTFDCGTGKFTGSRASLSGTVRNCAGGVTPWGTWLTCEETLYGPEEESDPQYAETHGWIFEVPADGNGSPKPLKDMGRFVHEAVAVDPKTSIVYETEDRSTSGLYRFLPKTKGKLADGGTLQMMKVPGQLDLSKNVTPDSVFENIEWVTIDDPTIPHVEGTTNALGVYSQGRKLGGTNFARLEGIWHFKGSIFFDSTSGGDASAGQIWEYVPAKNTLRLIFESPDKRVLNMPDNLTISPRGGILLCEDCGTTTIESSDGIERFHPRLQALSPEGEIFPLGFNNVVIEEKTMGIQGDFRGSEWTGVNFSPDGQWLFVNIQSPGFTAAITGPWAKGFL